jgi:Ca2+-binding EF-hand superfamily protein
MASMTQSPPFPKFNRAATAFNSSGEKTSLTEVIFNKHDTDDNGALDKEEFKHMVYSLGRNLSDQEIEAAFTFVELSGDQRITYKEFLFWWQDQDRWGLLQLTETQLEALHMLSEVFQYYDEDYSGSLDYEQFSNVFQYMKDSNYQLDENETVEGCLNKIDTSKDGIINYNEFIVWCCELGVIDSAGIIRKDVAEEVKKELGKLPSEENGEEEDESTEF